MKEEKKHELHPYRDFCENCGKDVTPEQVKKEICNPYMKSMEELKKYRGWVKIAVCPNCDGSGAYYVESSDGEEPDVQQCQWCDYKKRFLEFIDS